MNASKMDALVHPIRLRIVLEVAGDRMTPQQIAARLTDVPQASLYRHINRLSEAGILQVVEEVPVRGAVEKVYAVCQDNAQLKREDLEGIGKEEHLHYFTNFMTMLLGQFRAYLLQEKIDFVADGVRYHTAPVYLTDDEFQAMSQRLIEIERAAEANAPTPERRRRVIAFIAIPERRDP